MSSGMPELGSKISLISKADIRYEGRLFTVDPQECTIALASVRSFGTEDRETQYPVAPQSQVYDYILFRGTDIKDIRVLNNVPSMPNDPAIMQMSVPPSLGGAGAAPAQFAAQFNHPVVGQTQYPQYHPMAGFPGGVHAPGINKTSELSPQTSMDMPQQSQPATAPIGSGVSLHSNQVKDQGSMLDLLSGNSQQTSSRSGTPAAVGHRKSPTADQGTQQVGSAVGQRDRRGSTGKGQPAQGGSRNRTSSRNRQRYPSGGPSSAPQNNQNQQYNQHQNRQYNDQNQTRQYNDQNQTRQYNDQNQTRQYNDQNQTRQYNDQNRQYNSDHQQGQGFHNRGGGGWRGRSRGRGRGFVPRNKNTLKFDKDYDFEQANTQFEELRSQLAKTKISDGEIKPEGETDKKDDSGNETGAGEPELEDDSIIGYDKTKSFFDNISCEAVERSKGRSQRIDWRIERKLNSETFGVALARRGAWRGRPGWRHPHPQHNQPMNYFPNWRGMRGGNRGGNRPNNQPRHQPRQNQPANSSQSQPAAAPATSAK